MGKAAVILCAGVGSRMGLPPDINKCAAAFGGYSAVGHTLSSLLYAGVSNFYIVVGHAEDSVRNALSNYIGKIDIKFCINSSYDFHGCNYSLACGVMAVDDNCTGLIVAEGDSLLHPDSFKQLAEVKQNAASLIRSPEYINPKRSVVAAGKNKIIEKYLYDQSHTGILPALDDEESILGESMQLWYFSGEPLKKLIRNLNEYKNLANNSEMPMTESGVYTINNIEFPITPVMSKHPDDWLNLNTKKDMESASELRWLQK
ncbi:MAG: NTP transferase domain-containing protein [Defluviitaleaceae bacterium]|nr:NTP transferase domain-containing protein [Defluviitaleaceae bacterium]